MHNRLGKVRLAFDTMLLHNVPELALGVGVLLTAGAESVALDGPLRDAFLADKLRDGVCKDHHCLQHFCIVLLGLTTVKTIVEECLHFNDE